MSMRKGAFGWIKYLSENQTLNLAYQSLFNAHLGLTSNLVFKLKMLILEGHVTTIRLILPDLVHVVMGHNIAYII